MEEIEARQAKTGSGRSVERHTVRLWNQFAVKVFVSEHFPKMKVMAVNIQTQLFVIRHWASYEHSGSDRFEGVGDWAGAGSSRSA